MDFIDYFDPETDLLYGRNEVIFQYQRRFQDHWKPDDTYSQGENAWRRRKRLASASPKCTAQYYTSVLRGTASSTDPLVNEYYAQGHTKYPYFAQLEKHKQLTTACKFLLIFAGTMRLNIYFLLDGLVTDQIAEKDGWNGNSITAIELRNIYRNRSEDWVKSHVFFFNNYERVNPPWIADSATWAKYSKRRIEKMIKEYEEGIDTLNAMARTALPTSSSSSSSSQAPGEFNTWSKEAAAKHTELVNEFKGLDNESAGAEEEELAMRLMVLREILKGHGLLTFSKNSLKDPSYSLPET